MVANIVSILYKALLPTVTKKSSTAIKKVSGSNPFANPFVTSAAQQSFTNYAKNSPVQGGYFAGYHNGKANIVGQRLFLEA